MFIQIIWSALKRFKEEDKNLFVGKRVMEECVSHRIALYIQEIILSRDWKEMPDLNNLKQEIEAGRVKIDIEYDKSSDRPKEIDGKLSRPDILIHHRGDCLDNYAYIELKKGYRNKRDGEKCLGAKKAPYKYQHVLIIDCLIKSHDKIRVFEIVNESGEEKKHSYSALNTTSNDPGV
jgi:hypothetical protein